MKVSIIVSAYNEENDIAQCINSLLVQSYKDFEIIVLNDGSTDNTNLTIQQFNNNLKIKIFKTKHLGTALARNYAATNVKGKILVFLDADMVFLPDFINKLVSPILSGKARGTFSRLEYVQNWNEPLARCWNWNNIPKLPDRLRVPVDSVGEDFRAILKSEFDKVKGFDNVGYNDTWTLKKKLGYGPKAVRKAKYYHKNPQTLPEVFSSAQWMGKRKYKLGNWGNIFAIIRAFILFSIIKGIYKGVIHSEPRFILFQVVYDLGITKGALSNLFFNDLKK
jgi:glycosyltransferase involved in cell wall biosynthesis